MAGGGAEGIRSTLVDEESLRAICRKFSIPEDYKPACAGDDGGACKAPPRLELDGPICVYESTLNAGMRLPLQPFYCEVLRHYGLPPSQLAPNAWRYMAAFAVHCANAGVRPRASLFCFFFTISTITYKNNYGDCWYAFKVRKTSALDTNERRLFYIGSQPSSEYGWKEKYFFLSSPTGDWPFPAKWGKLRTKLDPEPHYQFEKDLDKLYRKKGVDLMSFLSRHKLPPALAPATEVQMARDDGTVVVQKENNSGGVEASAAAAARTGSATSSKRKSPDSAAHQPNPLATPLPGSPPGDGGRATRRGGLFMSSDYEHGGSPTDNGDASDVWFKKLKDGFGAAMDVVKDENALLRNELAKAREAAKVEIAKVREAAETAAKAEITKVREAAKAEVDEASESETAAKAELINVREAAKAEVAEARKWETAARAELSKVRKSQDARLQELIKPFQDWKAKLQNATSKHAEYVSVLNNEVTDTFNSVLDTATKSVAAVTAADLKPPTAYP